MKEKDFVVNLVIYSGTFLLAFAFLAKYFFYNYGLPVIMGLIFIVAGIVIHLYADDMTDVYNLSLGYLGVMFFLIVFN